MLNKPDAADKLAEMVLYYWVGHLNTWHDAALNPTDYIQLEAPDLASAIRAAIDEGTVLHRRHGQARDNMARRRIEKLEQKVEALEKQVDGLKHRVDMYHPVATGNLYDLSNNLYELSKRNRKRR